MRKLFLMAFLSFCVALFAQDNFFYGDPNFQVKYANGRVEWTASFDIGYYTDFGRFSISKAQVAGFNSFMVKVREKYEKWEKISKENDIKDTSMKKYMELSFPNVRCEWVQNAQPYRANATLKAYFIYKSYGEYQVRLEAACFVKPLKQALYRELGSTNIERYIDVISAEALNKEIRERKSKLDLLK